MKFTQESRPSTILVEETAKVFIQVFAGHPWFEVNKCGNCGHFFGRNNRFGETCPRCTTGILESAYTKEERVATISELFEKPNATVYLVENQGHVEGFAWGYPRSLEKSILKFEDSVKPLVANRLKESLSASAKTQFYSIAEIGLRETLRGKGLGKTLLSKLLNDAQKLDAVATVWTRKDTLLAPICHKAGFAQIFGPELVIKNGKVVETGTIIAGVDKDTPERVFYVN